MADAPHVQFDTPITAGLIVLAALGMLVAFRRGFRGVTVGIGG